MIIQYQEHPNDGSATAGDVTVPDWQSRPMCKPKVLEKGFPVIPSLQAISRSDPERVCAMPYMVSTKIMNYSNGLILFILLLSPIVVYASNIAEIKPKVSATLSDTYIWDGKELKLKSGAKLENTWTYNGKEIKPKSGATLHNTYVWSGRELKPKSGTTLSNTYDWNGKEIKPRSGATLRNTWVFYGKEWKQKSGATSSNTWVVTGSIPVPVCALIIMGIIR